MNTRSARVYLDVIEAEPNERSRLRGKIEPKRADDYWIFVNSELTSEICLALLFAPHQHIDRHCCTSPSRCGHWWFYYFCHLRLPAERAAHLL